MSCEDIPSLQDLQKVKKHADDFGRLMGTGTGTSTNEVTGQVRPTYNAVMANFGYTRVGTFASGGTLTTGRQTLLWDIADGGDGQEYGWSGSFPLTGKVVSPGSTPLTTGGIAVGAWMSRFDPELRIMVRESLRRSYAEAGYNLVAGSFEAGGTLNSVSDVLLQESSGKAYGWAGTFPKVVAAGSPVAGFASKDLNSLSEQITEFEPSVLANGVSAIKKAGGANGIKFMTWNVWSWYTIPNYFNNDYFGTKKLSLTANIALENGVSVCGLQEVWMPRTSNDLLSRGIYKGTFNGNSGDLYVMGNANWTAHNIVSSRTGQFVATDGELRGYANSVVNVDGTQVSVYTTHMTHLGGAVLNQQMQELATLVKADTCPRIVVMGDFNVNGDAAYAPLISAGLVMINKFGEYNTNNDGGTWYMDRIFYKGFSRHDMVGVLSPHKSLGDHKPLYATLYV